MHTQLNSLIREQSKTQASTLEYLKEARQANEERSKTEAAAQQAMAAQTAVLKSMLETQNAVLATLKSGQESSVETCDQLAKVILDQQAATSNRKTVATGSDGTGSDTTATPPRRDQRDPPPHLNPNQRPPWDIRTDRLRKGQPDPEGPPSSNGPPDDDLASIKIEDDDDDDGYAGYKSNLALKLYGKPTPFTGENRALLEDFLESLMVIFESEEAYFNVRHRKGNLHRITALREYTAGDANLWIRQYLRQLSTHTANPTWHLVLTAFNRRWRDTLAEERATEELHGLRMGNTTGSAEDYINKFNLLLLKANIFEGDSSIVPSIFKRGLSLRMLNALASQPVDNSNLQSIQSAVLEQDQQWVMIVARNTNNAALNPRFTGNATGNAAAQPAARPIQASGMRYTRNAIKCYACNQFGHISTACPNPPSNPRKHVTAIEVESSEDLIDQLEEASTMGIVDQEIYDDDKEQGNGNAN